MLWLFMYIETQNFNYSWKKGLVRQILKETENHDSQDTHVRFFKWKGSTLKTSYH